MATSTSSSPQPKPGAVATTLAIVIIVVLIAAVIGISFLPQPYYAIGQVVIYVDLVAVIAVKLRTCLRLAQGSEYLPKLHGIVLWVVLGVLAVVAHLEDLFKTTVRDYIRLATNVAVYLALLYALELVERLLKRALAESKSATDAPIAMGAATAPNQLSELGTA